MSDVDEQIEDGYTRLNEALAPPPNVAGRVERRVTVRRRRRRATAIGVAAAAVVATVGTAVALSGGDEPGDRQTAVDQPPGPESTLVMTRPDGSTYAFPDVTMTCTAPDGAEAAGDGRIWLLSPRRIEGERVVDPFVYAEGIVAKLQGDRTFDLPVDGPGGSDTYPLVLFMADSRGTERNNEVSSAEVAAVGTVRVLRASCDRCRCSSQRWTPRWGARSGRAPSTSRAVCADARELRHLWMISADRGWPGAWSQTSRKPSATSSRTTGM